MGVNERARFTHDRGRGKNNNAATNADNLAAGETFVRSFAAHRDGKSGEVFPWSRVLNCTVAKEAVDPWLGSGDSSG